MKSKILVSWMKNLRRDNRDTNKTMVGEELLEKTRQGENWAHWHQKKKRPLETLTCDFQKFETSLWKKNLWEP
jgi:hypothetical protein